VAADLSSLQCTQCMDTENVVGDVTDVMSRLVILVPADSRESDG